MQTSAALDEMVEEYLLFRGMNETLAQLKKESKHDRLQAFNREKLAKHLISLCKESNIDELWSTWTYLVDRFGKDASPDLVKAVDTTKQLLRKYALVSAVEKQNRAKLHALLAEMSTSSPEPSQWYSIAHINNPQSTLFFSPFFTSEWKENVYTHVCNTVTLLFQRAPQPRLLALRSSQLTIRKLEARVQHLMAELEEERRRK